MEAAQPNNLTDWLSWLERQHPVEIDMGLERVAAVAQVLGVDARSSARADTPQVITVAGTNGKGSTLAAFEALLGEAQANDAPLSYGKYTSPHIRRFNERIVINGEPASDADICNAFLHIEHARRSARLTGSDAASDTVIDTAPSLTYFEFATLAALYLFQQAELDFWLLEVGLGGRLDAVNIVDPDIAIITAIGFDHQDYLGDTLDQIGAEKAGIARPGIPVLVASLDPPEGLLQGIASRRGDSQLMTATELARWQQRGPQLHPAAWWAAERALSLANPQAMERLTEANLNALASQVSLQGRLQELVWNDRQVVLDVSHNLESVTRLADWLRCNRSGGARVHTLMAAMVDKPCAEMQQLIAPLVDSWSFCSLPLARAMTAEALERCWTEQSAKTETLERAQVFDNMKTALNSLVQSSRAGDKIVIFGSFYTVAAALEVLDSSATAPI